MENGVEEERAVVSGSESSNRGSVDGVALELEVDGSKGSDGEDEVFEEAIEDPGVISDLRFDGGADADEPREERNENPSEIEKGEVVDGADGEGTDDHLSNGGGDAEEPREDLNQSPIGVARSEVVDGAGDGEEDEVGDAEEPLEGPSENTSKAQRNQSPIEVARSEVVDGAGDVGKDEVGDAEEPLEEPSENTSKVEQAELVDGADDEVTGDRQLDLRDESAEESRENGNGSPSKEHGKDVSDGMADDLRSEAQDDVVCHEDGVVGGINRVVDEGSKVERKVEVADVSLGNRDAKEEEDGEKGTVVEVKSEGLNGCDGEGDIVVEAHPIKLNGEIKLIGALESSPAHLNGTETTGAPEEVRSDVVEFSHVLEDDGGNDIKIKEKQLNETVIHNQESFENGELHLNGDSSNADYEGTSEIASAQEGKELLKVAPDVHAVPERVMEILTSETPIMERELISEAEEADEGVMENSSSTGGIKGPRTPILEFERETVSIEEVGDTDSSDSDENKPSMDQPVQKSTTGPLPPSRPAGLGSSAPLPDPTPRVSTHLQQQQSTRRVNGSVVSQPSDDASATIYSEPEEGSDETREKLQMIRVKFLRLAHRLGQTPHNVVVAQVLYRLGLAEQLRGSHSGRASGGAFSFDRASAMAEQLEAAGQEALDFSCTIMIIGKSGVGKTATINSIFDEVKFRTDAFQAGTTKVQDIVGTVQGINVRVIDTPGLSSAYSDQRKNEKILHSVKRFINKTPPDIVLYLDRLDMQSRDHGDISLLRAITDVFGPLIWFNAIVVLTHAASAPPDGPNGAPLSYEMFVSQRSHVIQQAIRQAAGDARLMNPVALVENHSACRINRAGQRVLPNGQVWKPQLLLLSFASKILAEANMLLKLEDSPPVRPFQTRGRVPPLPFLLSTLLQSRPPLRLPEEQFVGEDSLDEDSDDGSESGDEPEYDELPPFRRLTKAMLAKLSRAQKKAYFEELDYREKLFMKKQMKEEKKRRRFLKKMEEAASSKDTPPSNVPSEGMEEDGGSNAALPVAMPDLTLPNSFDSDSPSYRYRFLDSNSPWLVRAVLDSQGWDHEVGYDGLSFERLFVAKEKVPVSVTGQLTKDKKDFNLQMELAGSINHSEGHATSMGLDMQTVGKDMLCTLRGEAGFTILKRNKTTLGVSATRLGDALMAGLKVEDNLVVNKRLKLLMSGGMMTGRGDVAYGGRLEATLRDKDYPLGKTLSTLALSIVDWHGDLAIACNTQLQFPVGRATNVVFHGNLSNKGTGQIGIRLNSTEHLQIALVALVPLFRNIKRLLYSNSQSM